MTLREEEENFRYWLQCHNEYKVCRYEDFDYCILSRVNTVYGRKGGHSHRTNEIIIMADTETSKNPNHLNDRDEKGKYVPYENHLVAWTISLRAAGTNIVTLYGSDPESNMLAIQKIMSYLVGDRTVIYYHNLSYDWVFLRQFYFKFFGEPERQLNTKSHYPILIEFENGLILKDSLILAQRSLEKWSEDLNVEHKKAVNEWDYDKIRNQGGSFSKEELEYIEHDTLAGVECLDAMRNQLHKTVATMPYTATGIVREGFRKVARENRGREWFLRQCLDFNLVSLSERVYHGGYTHQNRFLKNVKVDHIYTNGEDIICWDLASSYPFALISGKYPSEKFTPYADCKPMEIVKASENFAFMFTLELYSIELADPLFPMPYLQYSKAEESINALVDNGRIIAADYVRISITEIDLQIIISQYKFNEEFSICKGVYFSRKDYLPRWFTDFVYSLFGDKTMLKGADPVLYELAKSKLNSCYGMCCQHVMQDDIIEDYETGEYTEITQQTEESYEKYLKNKNTFLPYQIGIWCTCYAVRNLFDLGSCIGKKGQWIYSDTDSCFGFNWDTDQIRKYNSDRIQLMKDRGYEGIEHNGRVYHLGIAELDKTCTEFKGIHSKCYCYRDKGEGKLHITVAGVPKKKGVKCLDNDIDKFKTGFVFNGKRTGKLTHNYIFQKIHKDEFGNLVGDSIDLSPCDYLVNDVSSVKWDDLVSDEIELMRDYDDTE